MNLRLGHVERTYLTSKTVFSGFMAAWFLAASPINRSLSLKETKDGVVKLPCSLAMISTLLPSYVATQEYVVPTELATSASDRQLRDVLRKFEQVDE